MYSLHFIRTQSARGTTSAGAPSVGPSRRWRVTVSPQGAGVGRPRLGATERVGRNCPRRFHSEKEKEGGEPPGKTVGRQADTGARFPVLHMHPEGTERQQRQGADGRFAKRPHI